MQRTFKIMDGLFLIDLPQDAEGFEKFISAWFLKDNLGRKILIETGPASTIPLLISELSGLTDCLDYIFLTHVHLDHSGGVGHLIKKFNSAKVLVSAKGRKHLIAPDKLWKASVSTIGDIANLYGEPLPIPPDVLLAEGEGIDGVEIFETPGHAPHHISFRIPFNNEYLLFAGEAAGMTLPDTESLYLRPTTPPKFDANAAFSSLDLLLKVSSEEDILCYSHFGSDANARQIIIKAKEQLFSWINNITEWHKNGMENNRMKELLLLHDPMLSSFSKLPKQLQSREHSFINNSIQGLIGWIKSQPSS